MHGQQNIKKKKEKSVLDNPIKYYPIIFIPFYSSNFIISFNQKHKYSVAVLLHIR